MKNSLRNILLLSAVISSVQADIITDWNNAALNAIRADGTPPPKASRALAMTHLAVYDAVNSITLTHEAYLGYQAVTGPTSQEAAAAQAAYSVLSSLYPSQEAVFAALRNNQVAAVADTTERSNGMALGQQAALDMIAARSADHSTDVVSYTNPAPGTVGAWTPTPAGYASYLLPQWKDVTPFAMTSGSQFQQAGSPDINSVAYTEAYNEVKLLGAAVGSTRTADQTIIAKFWADGAGSSTPPGHWNIVAQNISSDQGLGLAENARLFALLNMATADAAISAWDMKYDDALWRPVTAIRLDDGNPLTEADATWSPLLPTPPFPSYVSGHSTFSAAAGGILSEYFGTDLLSFSVTSETASLPAGYTRSFTSISDAVDEAGKSRIYGGIHFEFDNVDGKIAGAGIADYVSSNYLQAVPEPSSISIALLAGIFSIVRRKR